MAPAGVAAARGLVGCSLELHERNVGMNEAVIKDQYAVDWRDDSGQWIVLGRFSDYAMRSHT